MSHHNSEDELDLDVNKLMFGDALNEMGEIGAANLGNVSEINVDPALFNEENKAQVEKVVNQKQVNRASLKNPEDFYTQRMGDSDSEDEDQVMSELPILYSIQQNGHAPTNVYEYSGMMLPDTDKLRRQMNHYNRDIMEPIKDKQNEKERQRKRDEKEDYKKAMKKLAHQAKFANPNQALEDFWFLQGHSKQGAPQTNKKQTWPASHKHFQASSLPGNVSRVQQRNNQPMRQPTSAQKPGVGPKTEQIDSTAAVASKALTFESCQALVVDVENDTNNKSTESNSPQSQRPTLKSAKRDLQQELKRKFPVGDYSEIEKQRYAFMRSITSGGKSADILPSDYQMQEWIVEQRYKQIQADEATSGVPLKRKKYWGEPKDCSSHYQLAKDAYVFKKHEWSNFARQNKTLQKPIFAICKEEPVKPAATEQKKDDKQQTKPPPKQEPKTQQVQPTNHNLIQNFVEYEALKQKEKKLYSDSRPQVSAESIMRHVRWKLKQMSNQDFYAQEYAEETSKQVPPQPSNRKTYASQTRQKPEEQKQQSYSIRSKQILNSLEENLDVHFDRKRLQIQEEIMRKKEKKEKANQQNQKPSTTTAYEPLILKQSNLRKFQEDENRQRHDSAHNSGDSSSSDTSSDEEQDDMREKQKRVHSRVLPSLGDELNHAKCIKDLSFYKLNWDEEDLETFHRPDIGHVYRSLTQTVLPMVANPAKKEETEKRLNPHDYFKDRFKLSLNKGKFCIFEHIDQHPLFVNNFGMASRLKRYYYGERASKKMFLQRHENRGTRHMGPHGEIIHKGKREKLDLLGQVVELDVYKGLAVLENKMYNAPVFFHTPGRTDFFCSVSKTRLGEQRIVIRELESLYTVGQIEPKLEVYNPTSRYYQNFIKQRSKAYIIRFLQENKVINFQDIVHFFPKIGEPILKKGLKEIEVEVDRNGQCTFNSNFEEEKYKDRMTPEMICQYESARHGQHRLEKLGITEILSADKISYSTNKFCQEETDTTLQRVAKLIESEVLSTPWNLSFNYIRIKNEGSMMMLQGQGDPSFGHGGYSFLKMPLKISCDSIQGARKNRMNLNPAIQNPKQVTGTKADLRTLQKGDIYQKLLKVGISEEQLQLCSRWQMVALLRHVAPNQDENKQYARGVRYTSKKQQEMYTIRANETFRKQMDNLSEHNPSYINAESEEEPNFLYTKPFTKPAENEDDKDFKECKLNAADFAEDIRSLIQDDNRKFIVEVPSVGEIKKLEDIPQYLKLLLIKLPSSALAPTSNSQQCRTIGMSQPNIDLNEVLNAPQGQQKAERILLEKLENREISKKCEILCKRIKSLVNEDPDKEYTRVVFSADIKTIKKFKRCKNKNITKIPRSKKVRQNGRATKTLTEATLGAANRKAFGSRIGGSVSSSTIKKKQGDNGSMYSVPTSKDPSKIRIGGTGAGSFIGSQSSTKTKTKRRVAQQAKAQSNLPRQIIKVNLSAQASTPQVGDGYASYLSMHGLSNQPSGQFDAMQESMPLTPVGQPVNQKISLNLASMIGDSDQSYKQNYDAIKTSPVRLPASKSSARLKHQVSVAPAKPAKKVTVKAKKQQSASNRFKSLGFGRDDFAFESKVENKSSRKRQQQSDQALNQIFDEVIVMMMDADLEYFFHNQVTKQDAPNYKDLIKKPIALKDMKNKTKRNEYKNRAMFFADVTLMRTNAETFNGPQHRISQIARDLEKVAIDEIEKRGDEIINLETLVQENTHI